MKKLYLVLAAVAVVGIGLVAVSVGSAGGNAATAPVAVEGLDDPERLVELARGMEKGDASAPVTIIEFGDFQCPGCQAFALQVKPQLELTYVESGKARFVFYDFPIVNGHPNAFLAARASRCAADLGTYWEYHESLFRNQARWAPMASPGSTFIDYAEALGIDRDGFASCLNSDRHAELVTANMELGSRLNVRRTPTILVERGGSARPIEADFQTIAAYVDGVLSEGSGAP